MTQASDSVSGSVTDFTYSGGLRIGAETTTGEDTSSEVFEWDALAGVPLLLADAGHEYIYGVGSAPVAQVDTTTGVVEFLHGDLVGSTRAVTDSSGVVVGAWDYSMFGVVTTATGGASGDGVGVTRFLFAGEYLDDTGLYYLRARFYDPVTASFLSVDPALSVTGSPYAYASGNPLQLVDPLGLWSSWGDIGDGLKSAASATGNWIADNKAGIVGAVAGTVVGLGCLAVTGGGGSVACAALGGAVGSMVTYAMDTPQDCWTAGGFFSSGLKGAAIGMAFGVAGKAVASLASRAFSAVASKASPAIRNAISRTVAVVKPANSAVDDGVEYVQVRPGFQPTAGRGGVPGSRPGQPFTRAGKDEVLQSNASAAPDGIAHCSSPGCAVPLTRAQQSARGVTPRGDEAAVDHVVPQSGGGSGGPSNGAALCRARNVEKSDRPWPW